MASCVDTIVCPPPRSSTRSQGVARPAGEALSPGFFARPSDVVAAELVGKILWRDGVGGGRLTEVEAYLPANDPACHAFRGPTPRNSSMFGPPGSIYVYLSYGIHVLLNLVCERESVGSAVLVRSFEPLGDTSGLLANRLGAAGPGAVQPQDMPPTWLSCGPGRVGQALALTLALDGLALGVESGLHVLDDGYAPHVRTSTRIGISKGDRLPLRFCAAESPFVTQRRSKSGGKRDETA